MPNPTIWVVTLNHKHGTTISCYSTEQLARDSVVRWAADNWEQEVCEGDRAELDDDQLVARYFEHMDGEEDYDIDSAELDADVPT